MHEVGMESVWSHNESEIKTSQPCNKTVGGTLELLIN